jgi:hypothetical protein
VRGERVATLLNNEVTTSATFTWHGTTTAVAPYPGVYFARLTRRQVATCKLAAQVTISVIKRGEPPALLSFMKRSIVFSDVYF